MTQPSSPQLQFFVFIVESPSAPDLCHGRSEGQILAQSLQLSHTPCVARTAISVGAFEAALKIGLPDEMVRFPNLLPILHISAHGDVDGIQLSDSTVLSWADLRVLLHPINDALGGNLVVSMSCCHGYSGTRMAMFTDDPTVPFRAIIGNGNAPTWSDTTIAFSTFYHLLAKGSSIPDAVEAMRVASGDGNWYFTTGDEARAGYLNYIALLDAGEVQQTLQDDAQQLAPDVLAKLTILEQSAQGSPRDAA